MLNRNILLMSDSYKYSHWKQYPPHTEFVCSYIEPRGIEDRALSEGWIRGRDEPVEIVHFGLQYLLKEYLKDPITKEMVDEAEELVISHGEPFNRSGFMGIVNKYGGRWPVYIEALPEGSIISARTPQVQVWNTDPDYFWVPSFLETMLHRAVWYPSTVATLSRQTKKIIYKFLKMTCADPDTQILFKLHDFGARGASSEESAMLGGMAHLVNFLGTDTISAVRGARVYYNEHIAGFSIPAAEHSTITTWGGEKGEVEAFRNMLKQFGGPSKLVAVVSDSYDIYRAVSELWGETLKDEVIKMGGTLVIRPDSGDPILTNKKIFEILGEKFGFTVNRMGYKVLPPYVRVIQGDGVYPGSIYGILDCLSAEGWSAENIAFGMGGALLQKVNRDDLKYAMKTNEITIDGVVQDVYKKPVGDPSKASKAGKVKVVNFNGGWNTLKAREGFGADEPNQLIRVFEDGSLYNETTLAEVRERAKL